MTPWSGASAEPAKFLAPGIRTIRSSPTSIVSSPRAYFPGAAPAADMASVVKRALPSGLARTRFLSTGGGR